MDLQEKESFIIDNTAKAEWAMKQIAKYKKKIAYNQEQYQQMIKNDTEWLQSENEHYENNIAHFEAQLMPFISEQLKDSNKKSFTLPSGKAGFRAASKNYLFNGIKVTNTAPDLINFIKQSNADYIETKESVKWGEFKKTLVITKNGVVVTKDGEIIPGMKVEQGEDKFYTEVK